MHLTAYRAFRQIVQPGRKQRDESLVDDLESRRQADDGHDKETQDEFEHGVGRGAGTGSLRTKPAAFRRALYEICENK
ncbi:hypothetical protein WJ969_08545 [Achromobacter xylosoxidans]